MGELSQRLAPISKQRASQGLPAILLHTDAAQALGKISVDVQELQVNYLTIVGHKVLLTILYLGVKCTVQ